jgi:diguanylate cyclase (GGDEF)-like protein
MKKDSSNTFSNSLNKTINNIYLGKPRSKVMYVILVILYFAFSFLLMTVARSQKSFTLFGNAVPFSAFTGVLSLLDNVCIIFLVIFYRKLGFITSLIILFIQFPLIFINFFVRNTSASIPGLFTTLFMVGVVMILYLNSKIVGKYQEKIRYQAVTDTLTGLPNRFACTELIDDFVRSKTNFTVISVDINNFKSINDTMGHDVGNKVLIEIASRWKAMADSRRTKTVDFVARIGGDEFAIVSLGYNDNNDIIATITAYRNELEKIITIDDCDYYITAAFGYAKFPTDSNVGAPLLSCADAAVHAVKRQGLSNCVLRFTPAFWEPERYIEMERKIRTALKNDSIFFYLQPQYDMDHKLRGFEALARMKDAVGAFISPADFIPVAEKTGLIDRIDMCVFKQAVKFLSDVLKKGPSDITVSFNISVRHLMKNGFMEEIREVIKNCPVPINHLELEITESIMVDSAEKALRRINEIKELGIKVAIDDFGTGYSSLNYLNKLPSDMLKIDKSFIDTLNTSESSKQYVASIVSIGHILNLKVISEGVEQPEQLEALRNMGCDYIQGFIWGKPLPPEEAVKLV